MCLPEPLFTISSRADQCEAKEVLRHHLQQETDIDLNYGYLSVAFFSA